MASRNEDRTYVDQGLRCLEHCALHRRTIKLTCPRCRHERRFDAVALWWLFATRRWDDALPGAYRRLYCRQCASAGAGKVQARAEITRDPPDPQQPPYPDMSTWKRLVSRYRS